MTHGEPDTYPRTADVLGFCRTEDAVAVAEAVVTVQRDWGDRANRKHARLKYTIEDRGLDAFRAEVEKRGGVKLDLARPYRVHLDRRSLRLDRRRRRARASHAVRRERPHSRRRQRRAAAFGAAPHRGNEHRRHSPHRQPEHHHRQCPGRAARRDHADRGRCAACCRRGPACGAIRWPASPCRPAGWRSPKASAICRELIDALDRAPGGARPCRPTTSSSA